MATEVKIPQISEGVETATVTEILVSEGDEIEKDQSIIAVESDKATVEIPSTHAGKVKSIKVSEDDEVNVGDVILTLEEAKDGDESDEEGEDENESEEETSKKKKSEKDKSEDKPEDKSEDKEDEDSERDEETDVDQDKDEVESDDEEKSSDKDNVDEDESKDDKDEENDEDEDEDKDEKKSPKNKSSKKDSFASSTKKLSKETKKDNSSVPASPGVRRFARELGVNISDVKGSGEHGRISKDDVKAFEKGGGTSSSVSQSDLPDFSQWGDIERKSLSGIRLTTAKKVSGAWQNIPHVFQFDEADITEIEEYIEKSQDKAEKAGGKLTITAVLTKLVADGLEKFPKFNASIDIENKEMILKNYINISIAVDTEEGLLLPVIKEVDKKGVVDLAVEISELAEKARNQKLTGEEMNGGNFSISNLGGIGGTNFTPIIYHPQVAILGVSRAQTRPLYIEGELQPRKILPLSLSYDHRLIDGAEAARFITWLKNALEDPFEALLS